MNLEDKVDKLKKETFALRKEMVIIKTLVKQQNEIIKSLLETANDAEVRAENSIKTKDWFPIRTQEQLDNFEKEVNRTNRAEIIQEAQLRLQREGMDKNLNKLLDEKLISNYNLEGNYNKLRLLDYQNLLDVLYKATEADGRDHTKFIAELRIAIRKMKKRQIKLTYHKKKRQRKIKDESEEDDDSECEDTDNDDNDDDDQ